MWIINPQIWIINFDGAEYIYIFLDKISSNFFQFLSKNNPRQFLLKPKYKEYESNDKTTDSLLRRRVGEDTEQLVQALPRGAPGDGIKAKEDRAAATHRQLDVPEVLHRHRRLTPPFTAQRRPRTTHDGKWYWEKH